MQEKKKYIEQSVTQTISLHPKFGNEARYEMAEMKYVISTFNEHIDNEIMTNRHIASKAGYIAEEAHAETFILDAISKGDKARAYTDKCNEWGELELNGRKLHANDRPDIVIAEDKKITTTIQSKYCRSSEETARQMTEKSPGEYPYQDMDQLLGPKDQINHEYKNVPGEFEPIGTTTIKDHSNAKADALEARGEKSRADAYRNTAKKATDRISNGKSESTPFTNQEMKDMASGDKSALEKVESKYQTESTIKHMGQAAVEAGAVSALLGGAANTLRCIKKVKDGEITVEKAALEIVKETACAAADSAVKASVNAGIQSLAVRYGTEEAAIEVLAKQGMKSLLKTSAITIGATCAIEGIKDLVRLGCGQISKEEFMNRQGQGALMTTSGTLGGAFGVELGTAVGTALGASEGWLAVASTVGGLAGGLMAGLAMTIAMGYGVERPFRELVKNSEIMLDSLRSGVTCAKTMANGAKLANEFVKADQQMELIFQDQIGCIREKLNATDEHAIDFGIIENEIRETRSHFAAVQAQLDVGEKNFWEIDRQVHEDGIRAKESIEKAWDAVNKLKLN